MLGLHLEHIISCGSQIITPLVPWLLPTRHWQVPVACVLGLHLEHIISCGAQIITPQVPWLLPTRHWQVPVACVHCRSHGHVSPSDNCD